MYLNSILYLFHGHADEYSIPELLSIYPHDIRELDEAAAVVEAHDVFAGVHVASFADLVPVWRIAVEADKDTIFAVIDFIDGQTGGVADGIGPDYFSVHRNHLNNYQ